MVAADAARMSAAEAAITAVDAMVAGTAVVVAAASALESAAAAGGGVAAVAAAGAEGTVLVPQPQRLVSLTVIMFDLL